MTTAETEQIVWDLSSLYSGPEDAALQRDMDSSLRKASSLEKVSLKACTPEELSSFLRKLEKVEELCARVHDFASLYFSTHTDDPAADRLRQQAEEAREKIRSQLLWFPIEWARLEQERASELSRHPTLDHYRPFLGRMTRWADHRLSESEERVLSRKELAARKAWTALYGKLLSGMEVGGRSYSAAQSDLHSPDRKVRETTFLEISRAAEGQISVFSHILNTIALDAKSSAELRSFPTWVSQRNLENEIPDFLVSELVRRVTAMYPLAERYYRLKSDILKIPDMKIHDRLAPVPGLERIYFWEEARDLVLSSWGHFSPGLGEMAARFFRENWIHAFPRKGKVSGAFSHPGPIAEHPFILCNFSGTLSDVLTLAHELGHGIHQLVSRTQGILSRDVSLPLAETASFFSEMLLLEHLEASAATPRERLGILCVRLERAMATVFRQVALYRFEEKVHGTVREQSGIGAKDMGVYWMQEQRRMFGGSMELSQSFQHWWCLVPHFVHTPGYVYSYALAQLVAVSLHKRYLENGTGFVPAYERFLHAGGTMSPAELWTMFGFDLEEPELMEESLSSIGSMLTQAEKMHKESP